MSLMLLLVSLLWNPGRWSTFFSNAIGEGIKDVFIEMGYVCNDEEKKEVNDSKS
jgi:hypothetical protein